MKMNLQFEPEQIRYTADVSFGTLSDIEQELQKVKRTTIAQQTARAIPNMPVTFATTTKAPAKPKARGMAVSTTGFIIPPLQRPKPI